MSCVGRPSLLHTFASELSHPSLSFLHQTRVDSDRCFTLGLDQTNGMPASAGAKIMATNSENLVLQQLAKSKAASLIELMSLVDVPDDEIEGVVTNLENQNLVSISGSGDRLNRIVTIRNQGLRAARNKELTATV